MNTIGHKPGILASLLAALFVGVAFNVVADAAVTAEKESVGVQGRAIDEVKAGKQTVDTQGRRIDEVKAGKQTVDTQGRRIEK